MLLAPPSNTPAREIARQLHAEGHSVAEIARRVELPLGTVASWKRRDAWENVPGGAKVDSALDARLCVLINKEGKSDAELKELDMLSKVKLRNARVRRFEDSGNSADLNPKFSKRRSGKKVAIDKKNNLSDAQIAELKRAYDKGMYPHQNIWHQAGLAHEIRQIVKSRQIGATLHFGREAFMRALLEGRNQIFISASKAQAHVFKRNIINFVRETVDVDLKGDPIILGSSGAELHFLGTNKNTAQSYSGDVLIDECFWIGQFEQIQHVASGMAVLDDRRTTYFSTPSTLDHPAYPLWSGEHFNDGRPKKDHIHIDISHKALRAGRLCEDGHWRQLINIEDAINSGYDCVSLEKLRLKFPPAKFDNLLMCKFIDSADSVFTMTMLQKCMVDSWEKWQDFNALGQRPLGDTPVWIGYDPSRTRDDASLAVVAPPKVDGGRFRLVEKMSMNGCDFEVQAAAIRKMTIKYNVRYIGIDTSGLGKAVHDLVKKFYPAAKEIKYSVEIKNMLVMKALQIISRGRFEYDAADKDLSLAFMTIYRTLTPSNKQITYQASRTSTTGHADEAWAVMHALDNQTLDFSDSASSKTSQSFIEFF